MALQKQKSHFKKLLVTSGVILIIFLSFALLARAMGWIGGESPGTEVETDNVELRTITQLVTASGRIQPEIEVILAPDVSGEIIELSVKEGDFVDEGDLLLRIRPDLIKARIDELQASLMNQEARKEQSRATMLQAEVSYNKQKQLYDKGLISEMEYINALRNLEAEQANFNASEFMVQNAQAQMRRAEEELRQRVIRAPMTGTISKLDVERGERVVGSVQMTGTELLRIARMEQMEVQIDVNENDIVNVKQDNQVRIQVDAYPNEIFEGMVTEIANSPKISGEGTTEQITEYPVKIRIHSPHNLSGADLAAIVDTNESEINLIGTIPQFKPGMTATVDIETQTVENIASVPIQAVTVRDYSTLENKEPQAPEAGEEDENAEKEHDQEQKSIALQEDLRRVVFIVNDGKAEMVEVETGISDDTFIYIKSGVNSGQEIITGNYRILTRELSDGDRIEVTSPPTRTIANRN
ncbi:MAG: efflux RND transporter periplasmic adaptor subunit [Balneolales bacterium]